jgi:hypothetical protein
VPPEQECPPDDAPLPPLPPRVVPEWAQRATKTTSVSARPANKPLLTRNDLSWRNELQRA